MKAMILAGGSGNRLRAYWAGVPKSMLPIFDRPALQHLIARLVECGITDIMLCLSKDTPEIAQYFGDGSALRANISYSIENEPMGTAGALRALGRVPEKSFLVLQGDAATDVDFAQIADTHANSGSIASVVYTTARERADYGVVQIDSENRLCCFIEKPSAAELKGVDTINTGIYVFEPDIFGSIPPFQRCGLSEQVFPRLINNGERVTGIPLEGYWQDIGFMTGYRSAHVDALSGRFRVDIPAQLVGPGLYIGEDVQIEEGVGLNAPVYIGSRASIGKSATIHSHSVVGAESLVGESAQVQNSILGMSSVVGAQSRVSGCLLMGHPALEAGSQENGTYSIRSVSYLAQKKRSTARRTQASGRVIIPV